MNQVGDKMLFTEEQVKEIKTVKIALRHAIDQMLLREWFDNGLPFTWDKIHVSGGAIASLIQGEKPKDIDIYFEDGIDQGIMRNLILGKGYQHIKDVDEDYKTSFGQNGKRITETAITMKDGESFIIMPPDSIKNITKLFDYVHCMPYYNIGKDELRISMEQYLCCKYKLLVVNNKDSLVQYRTEKFIKRGYKPIKREDISNEILVLQ
jgi:hypothetical protein